MADPIAPQRLTAAVPISPTGPPVRPAEKSEPGGDFAAMLRGQLERVNQMQAEADEGVRRILTGEAQNVTEVFTAARKAQVAFSLLMEMRNKLVDAYTELRQMRV